ncbi:MAG: hypothetical protein P9M12_00420 [Candidatus Aceula lacicola]|nr:hypothetical protein [Candidatus Aceula lacicola]
MSRKTTDIISSVLISAGVLLLMVMAFDLVGSEQENVVLFLGIACFVVSGLVKSIARIQEKYKK